MTVQGVRQQLRLLSLLSTASPTGGNMYQQADGMLDVQVCKVK